MKENISRFKLTIRYVRIAPVAVFWKKSPISKRTPTTRRELATHLRQIPNGFRLR